MYPILSVSKHFCILHIYKRFKACFSGGKKESAEERSVGTYKYEKGSWSKTTHVDEGIICGNKSSDTKVVNTSGIVYDEILSESISSINSIWVIYTICHLGFSQISQKRRRQFANMVQLCSQLSQVRQHLEGGNGTKLPLNKRDIVKNLNTMNWELGSRINGQKCMETSSYNCLKTVWSRYHLDRSAPKSLGGNKAPWGVFEPSWQRCGQDTPKQPGLPPQKQTGLH